MMDSIRSEMNVESIGTPAKFNSGEDMNDTIRLPGLPIKGQGD